MAVEIEFDPAKDEANIAKHGLSLAEASTMDLRTAAVVADDRNAYGEVRYLAFNRIDGKPHCLVFTVRDGIIRAISFRRAREKEIARYGR